ncbi:hypothetical protein BKA70DRAFT_1245939 [Coprinopsis sp. MPI-PUGE-AT-0042]|nr:hypothetical protein BKA70DRAFT_1245939 [Coprinopsis sp. MPI-PUGE-AT-0042]
MKKRLEAMEKAGTTVDMEEGSEELRKRKRAIMRSAKLNRRQTNTTASGEAESEASSSESGNDDVESISDGEASSEDEEGAGSEDEEDQPGSGIVIRPVPTASSTFIPAATGTSTGGGIGASGLPVPTGTGIPEPQPTSRAGVLASQQGIPLIFDEQCLHALTWLEDGLHDAQREDVTLVFANLWMGVIGIIAILTESLPHLGVAFFGHILSGGWATSRIAHTMALTKIYNTVFMGQGGICAGHDLLGTWWDLRMKHTIPLVVFNALTMIVLAWLTWKLFGVYQTQTFSRVGASPAVHRMYKVLLSFSVLLQLSAFFSLASASLWISRATSGTFMQFATHWKVYTGVFAVFMLLLLPWVILGWRCIRKECRTRSIMFFVLSVVLLGISSVMFASALYRTIFNRWSFFATLTLTSFILLVLTTALGVVCRINFGKGLAEYLDVTAALDGANFTPVRFDHNPDQKEAREDEKEGWTTFNNESPINEKSTFSPVGTHGRNKSANTFSEVILPQPMKKVYTGNLHDPTYLDVEKQGEYGSYQFTLQPASFPSQDITPLDAQDPFQTAAELTATEIERALNAARASRSGESVWSDNDRSPIKLSYSPTIVRNVKGTAAPPPPSAFNFAPSPPESRRASTSASTIMPDDSVSRIGAESVIDIRRGAQGEFKAVEAMPPSIEGSPQQPQLNSRWSATTVSTMKPPAPAFASSQPQQDRITSVMSQYPHPTLMVANPDAYRASVAASEAPVPPVPIPTSNVRPTGRGMVAAFPVVRRSGEL